MFRLRFTTEAQPRSNSGHPAQSTTGVASNSSIHGIQRPSARCTGIPRKNSDMPSRNSGTVNTRLHQNRRLMCSSSGFPSSSETVRGSSAMPQMGQKPGSLRTICGCIGQVHSSRVAGAGVASSSAIPHFGHGPGVSASTSGSMGHTHFVPGGAATGRALSLPRNFCGSASNFALQDALQNPISRPS